MIITYKRIEGSPRLTANLSNWDFEPYLPEIFFQFEAPEGSRQIEIESLQED